MDNSTLNSAKDIQSYLNETFYHLHSNPELSEKEFETQKYIIKELQRMGIDAKPIANTGVIGIIRGKNPGKTIALRADMDALPIQENTELPYKSKIPGVMHACGHDAHVTILLGAAKILQAQRDELSGNVKLFFQPAEETVGGAVRMIEEGCMENPSVDAIFFGHCSPDYPTGTIAVKNGYTSASSNYFTVTFKGKSTHGALPQAGDDVIVAASQAIVALQTICSRKISPTDSVVLSIGSIQAGNSSNILPGTATIKGIIRTVNEQIRPKVIENFTQILQGVSAAMGVEVIIDIKTGYPATKNDDEMVNLLKISAGKVLGTNKVKHINIPLLTLEDISYFCQKVPGCYYRVGIAKPENEPTFPLHNDKFFVDPNAIVYGTAVFVQTVKDFLSK